jgi:hypothetical protein
MRLLLTVALAASALGAGSPEARVATSTCANMTASLGAGGNGMTGGTYEWSLSITNRAAKPCTIYGRPFVRVPPTAFPVVITDLQPGEFGLNARPAAVALAPGASAHATILIVRNCGDFSKKVARTLRVTVGWAGGAASVSGEACAHGGATVVVGPFARS